MAAVTVRNLDDQVKERHRCARQICLHDRRRHQCRVRADEAPDGRRKELLRTTALEVFAAFEGQVLPFDSRAAVHYAEVVGASDQLGLPIDGFDAQIVSICRAHDAALATRNLKDFQHTGVNLIDPWEHQ